MNTTDLTSVRVGITPSPRGTTWSPRAANDFAILADVPEELLVTCSPPLSHSGTRAVSRLRPFLWVAGRTARQMARSQQGLRPPGVAFWAPCEKLLHDPWGGDTVNVSPRVYSGAGSATGSVWRMGVSSVFMAFLIVSVARINIPVMRKPTPVGLDPVSTFAGKVKKSFRKRGWH